VDHLAPPIFDGRYGIPRFWLKIHHPKPNTHRGPNANGEAALGIEDGRLILELGYIACTVHNFAIHDAQAYPPSILGFG
jgi:hypothetical protein